MNALKFHSPKHIFIAGSSLDDTDISSHGTSL